MYNYKVGFVVRLMRLALGIFFIALGIAGIFPQLVQGVFSLNTSYYFLQVVFGVVELICGFLLCMGFFIFKDTTAVYWGGFIVFILWCVRIVISKFIWGFSFINDYGNIVPAYFFTWLLVLLAEIIIALALLVVIRRYE
jgi:hypothetical protein